MEYDVFICHASEDKGFVEPLAKALMEKELERGKLIQPTVENLLLSLRCEFTYHTISHTFPLEAKLQYLGLN